MERIRENLQDHILMVSVIISLILAACHIWQYMDSGRQIGPLIRLVFCSLYFIPALIWGRNCWPYYFALYAYALVLPNRFYNYTSFCIIMLCILSRPQLKYWYVTIYIIDVLAALLINRLSASHCVIHLINCFCFHIAIESLRAEHFVKKPLELLSEEEEIVKELAAGKEIKELDFYSQNTIYVKLREARKRNKCANNSELIARYKFNR